MSVIKPSNKIKDFNVNKDNNIGNILVDNNPFEKKGLNVDLMNVDNMESTINSTIEDLKQKVENVEQEVNDGIKNLPKNLDYEHIQNEGFTPQGYSYIENKNGYDKIFITAYCKGEKSRIYVYNAKTGKYEGKIVLNTGNHVGGITYDTENGILFVTGKEGQMETYDYEAMNRLFELQKEDGSNKEALLNLNFDDYNGEERTKYKENFDSVIINNDISVLEEINKKRGKHGNTQQGMDSVYFHDGKLYSSTYSANGELIETELNIIKDANGNIVEIKEKSSSTVANIGPAVQGMSFYTDKDGKKYFVTASSAKWSSSLLTKYEVIDKGNGEYEYKLVGYQEIKRPGLEGIYIDGNGKISGIFEYDKLTEDDKNYQISHIDEINNDDSKGTGEMTYSEFSQTHTREKTIRDLLDDLGNKAFFWDTMHDSNEYENDAIYY